MKTSLDLFVLAPVGKVLLLGSCGYVLFQAVRGESDLYEGIESLVIATLAITFYPDAIELFQKVSNEMALLFQNTSQNISIKQFLLDSFKTAAHAPVAGKSEPESLNLPSLLSQAFRTGVWGVMVLVVEFFFILSSLLIECGQSIFLKLILFLAPIAAGIYPVFPHILKNQLFYAVELTLWVPILRIIDLVTAQSAREFMARDGSAGLYVIAIELIAVILIIAVPMITHRFLRGAFSGDMGAGAAVGMAKRFVLSAKGAALRGFKL